MEPASRSEQIKKREWKWIFVFALISIFIVGLMTRFKFHDLDIRFHDTYFVVESRRAVFYLTGIIYLIRGFYSLTDLMTDHYRFLAFIVAIVNPIVALFMIMLIYLGTQNLLILKESYPGIDLLSRLVPVAILIGLVLTQVIVEIKTLRKIWTIIKSRSITEAP